MALTLQEQEELLALKSSVGEQDIAPEVTSGLTAEEEQELAQLKSETAGTQGEGGFGRCTRA